MTKALEGKSAIITGAGRGIGREVALLMAKEGAKIVVVDPGTTREGGGRDTSPADDVVKEIKAIGSDAIASYDSVADFKTSEKIVRTCKEAFGSVDIVLNAAGVLRERMIYNLTEEDFDIVISVHLKGTFNMCRHASAIMKEQKSGRLINVTSDAWRGAVGQSNYSAAKAGIVGLTRSVARELGRLGITCNAMCPLASTRMTVTPEVLAGFKKRYEAGLITRERFEELTHIPGPEHIAPLAVFLASDASADLNGQVIGAYGGRVYLYSEPVAFKELVKEDQTKPWDPHFLMAHIPKTLMVGYVNPAPKAPAGPQSPSPQ